MFIGPLPYPRSWQVGTLFLCRMNVSPPIDEVSSATGTLVGNASIDTGNSQLVLDGAGDWLTFSGSAINDEFGGGDFTIEFHCDMAAAQVGGIAGRDPSGNTRWTFYCSGTGNMSFYANAFSTGSAVVGANSMLNGSEHHFALVREGSTYRLYRDGVQAASSTWASGPTTGTGTFYIGTDPFSTTGRDMAGRISRFKISNICRYSSGSTFTPPARTDF